MVDDWGAGRRAYVDATARHMFDILRQPITFKRSRPAAPPQAPVEPTAAVEQPPAAAPVPATGYEPVPVEPVVAPYVEQPPTAAPVPASAYERVPVAPVVAPYVEQPPTAAPVPATGYEPRAVPVVAPCVEPPVAAPASAYEPVPVEVVAPYIEQPPAPAPVPASAYEPPAVPVVAPYVEQPPAVAPVPASAYEPVPVEPVVAPYVEQPPAPAYEPPVVPVVAPYVEQPPAPVPASAYEPPVVPVVAPYVEQPAAPAPVPASAYEPPVVPVVAPYVEQPPVAAPVPASAYEGVPAAPVVAPHVEQPPAGEVKDVPAPGQSVTPRKRFDVLRQPISFKRSRPAAQPQAPVETAAAVEPATAPPAVPAIEYVAVPEESVAAPHVEQAPAAETHVPAPRQSVTPRKRFDVLRQPISFKRSRPAVPQAPAAGPVVEYAPVPAVPVLAAPGGEEPVVAQLQEVPASRQSRRSAPRRVRGVRRREPAVTGLSIEPGLLVAAMSHVNGHVAVERAAYAPIAIDVVRDGEVNEIPALAEALTELFKSGGLERRVRIGIANQRIMMRRIELPPLTDATEIAQAVQFQAQDEIPMPLESVVLDYHSLGITEGEAGPRLHVLIVAARRDMIERILQAARLAGLQPVGIDLAAFGMMRALRPADAGQDEQILYLSIGGLTNLAIGQGSTCEFTRVIGWGVEQIAGAVASRAAITLAEARRLLVAATVPAPALGGQVPDIGAGLAPDPISTGSVTQGSTAPGAGTPESLPPAYASPASVPAGGLDPLVQSGPIAGGEFLGSSGSLTPDHAQVAATTLNEGIRRIASEIRNSLDFYASAQSGSAVRRAVLCGPALEIPAFADALSRELGMPVERGDVSLDSAEAGGDVPRSLLAVAAGLSVAEGPA